ncbi:MAG: NAD(P)H-dependent oxidoreductase [Pseudomonadota bacterium]
MKLLRIDSSPRSEDSLSRRALDGVLSALEAVDLVHRDLGSSPLPHFDESWIGANFTPDAARNDEQRQHLELSDRLVAEVESADALLIGAPIYNFGTPARLKNWIDHLARAGLTFTYSADGPVGLLTDKPVRVLVSSGGTQVGSGADFSTPYLRHVLAFVGLRDVRFEAAQAVLDDEALRDALAADLRASAGG